MMIEGNNAAELLFWAPDKDPQPFDKESLNFRFALTFTVKVFHSVYFCAMEFRYSNPFASDSGKCNENDESLSRKVNHSS